MVADHHLGRIGKNWLVSFEASMYSVPACKVRAGQHMQVRACADTIAIHALDIDGGGLLAGHARASRRGSWMVMVAAGGQPWRVCRGGLLANDERPAFMAAWDQEADR